MYHNTNHAEQFSLSSSFGAMHKPVYVTKYMMQEITNWNVYCWIINIKEYW